jgi:hypothetical protein
METHAHARALAARLSDHQRRMSLPANGTQAAYIQLFGIIVATSWSTEKLAGFWRGGNSLKLSSHW